MQGQIVPSISTNSRELKSINKQKKEQEINKSKFKEKAVNQQEVKCSAAWKMKKRRIIRSLCMCLDGVLMYGAAADVVVFDVVIGVFVVAGACWWCVCVICVCVLLCIVLIIIIIIIIITVVGVVVGVIDILGGVCGTYVCMY